MSCSPPVQEEHASVLKPCQSVIYQALNLPACVPPLLTRRLTERAARRSHKAEGTGSGEHITAFLRSAPPFGMDYLPDEQKKKNSKMPSVSREDEIRWEIFRPLSSPLNVVVSSSLAPHQKGNTWPRGENKREGNGTF